MGKGVRMVFMRLASGRESLYVKFEDMTDRKQPVGGGGGGGVVIM